MCVHANKPHIMYTCVCARMCVHVAFMIAKCPGAKRVCVSLFFHMYLCIARCPRTVP